MSGDIVERLRRISGGSAVVEVTQEAADEIERLRADLAHALNEIRYLCDGDDDD